MGPAKRLVLLIGIMSAIVMGITSTTVAILYDTALEEQRARLEEIARSQARMIEAVARFDEDNSADFPGGPHRATLSQIVDAHSRYVGFGTTGEFTLAAKEGNRIVFSLSHRHADLDDPLPVDWDSPLAEPMRRALSGKSGTVIGLDYRGALVLAAYEPVAVLDLGIVAKIDLAEVRAPFVKAGLLSGAIALLLVGLGAALFVRITNPLVERLHTAVADLEKALGEVKTLQGIIPICSFCKKIRNDKGYWDQVDVYIRRHTDADFSHGICPDCLRLHYADLLDKPDTE